MILKPNPNLFSIICVTTGLSFSGEVSERFESGSLGSNLKVTGKSSAGIWFIRRHKVSVILTVHLLGKHLVLIYMSSGKKYILNNRHFKASFLRAIQCNGFYVTKVLDKGINNLEEFPGLFFSFEFEFVL